MEVIVNFKGPDDYDAVYLSIQDVVNETSILHPGTTLCSHPLLTCYGHTVCIAHNALPVNLYVFSYSWRLLYYPQYIPTVTVLFSLHLHLLDRILVWLELRKSGRKQQGMPFLSFLQMVSVHALIWTRNILHYERENQK